MAGLLLFAGVTPGMLMTGLRMLPNVTRTWEFLSIITGFFAIGAAFAVGASDLRV